MRRPFPTLLPLLLVLGFAPGALGQVPTNGLVAHYPLDGNAREQSAPQLDGVGSGLLPAADRHGRIGLATYLNGRAGISLPNLPALGKPRTSFTVSIWFSAQSTGPILSDYVGTATGGDGVYAFALNVDNNRALSSLPNFITAGSRRTPELPNDYTSYVGSREIIDARWHHAAYVMDGAGTCRLHLDGSLVASLPYSSELDYSSGAQWAIGSLYFAGANQFFTGSVDELRVYNRALTTAELTQLYASEASAAPIIVSSPSSRQVVKFGEGIALRANVVGATSFQWIRNGVSIAGATSATHTITNASTPAHAGWYQLLATNSSGTTKSSVIFLNVSTPVVFRAWGSNRYGQVSDVPQGPQESLGLGAGWSHLINIQADGSLRVWGAFTGVPNQPLSPAPPAGLKDVVQVAGNSESSLALRSDGTVVWWGFDNSDPSRFDPSFRTMPSDLRNVVQIASYGPMVVLTTDGRVATYGRRGPANTSFEPPAGLSEVVQIASAGGACAALKADGTVVAWGWNPFGICDVPAGLTDVRAISGGDYHFMALRGNGTVVCWGATGNTGLPRLGQSSVPPGLTNVVKIAPGGLHSLALRADGSVVGWGDSSRLQLPVPSNLGQVIDLVGFYEGGLAAELVKGPQITAEPQGVNATVGQTAQLRVTALGSPSPSYQWLKNGAAISGATEATLTFAAVSAADAGSYSVVVSNASGTVVSSPATLTVTAGSAAPAISAQPTARAVVAGNTTTLTVTASGTPAPAFQWLKDGIAVPGATTASLTLSAASREQAGSYSVVVSNAAGTVVSSPAAVSVVTGSALSNLSIRTPMAIGQTLIVGAVVSGGTKNVLVRAAGPALSAFGLAGMADPRLELFTGGLAPVTANDDWPANLASAFQAVGAFGFILGSRDAALQQSLNGSFTVQARGTGPGIVLVEAYDTVLSTSTRLVNLSARNLVGTGSDILIAGFAISGVGTKQLLIRAAGPALAGFGVTGALPDPRLEVFDSAGRPLAANDNWGTPVSSAATATTATFAQVGAFPLAAGSRDAALLITLNAGASYTVQVAGVNNTTGEALVEVYEVF